MFIGELPHDGSLRHTKGILSIAALMPDIDVIALPNLQELVAQLTRLRPLKPFTLQVEDAFARDLTYAIDFADIMGQEHIKRAMEVAAAGRQRPHVMDKNPCFDPHDSN